MPVISGSTIESRALRGLIQKLQHGPGFLELMAALKNGRSGTIDGAWGSAAALTAASIRLHAPSTVFVVIAHVGDIDDFAADLETFAGFAPEVFPAWDLLPREIEPSDEIFGQRLRIAKRVGSETPPRLVVAPMQAILQPVPRRDHLLRKTRTLGRGDAASVEALTAWLVECGLARVDVVEVAGEFSVRGGIVDVFAPDATDPVRIEFFGDELESIRRFNAETQRSEGNIDSFELTALASFDLAQHDSLSHIADYLPEDAWVLLVELDDLREESKQYLTRLEDPRGLFGVDAAFAPLLRRPTVTLSTLSGTSFEATCHLHVESVEHFAGDLAKVKAELDGVAGGERVIIACHNAGEAQRLREVFGETQTARDGRLEFALGHVRSGFRLIDSGIVVISDAELFDRTDIQRPRTRRRYESRAIDSFLDLNEGDYVVHVSHGIALYRGLQLVDKGVEHAEEQLVLEFAEGAKLYVSIAKIDLVQKYVGGGRAAPKLSKIGSTSWEKRKRRVAEAVIDLAAELIDLQAKRAGEPGFAYPAEDSHWMVEFEAAFPYQETPDQLTAIAAIKDDLSQTKPMDRLVCGDVGYGKTEVAMRAAFKVIDGGKQVGVLVPTTVLSEQHYRTFSRRMAEFPFAIEVINRFRPKSEVKEVLKRAAEGAVDLLIGTHRLVQKDVAFRDLGLVIIDEEQRFGVEDKEWLKNLRATVAVLTLSATPIPRTLHMSLLGIRDISNLETPPPDRKAIETRIARWDDELIRRAIHRELNRNGQIYFVHNKVYDIQWIADRLRVLVPEARVLVGHGQMSGEALERAMLAFVRHQADILVATTIIESGLDIPNANTIFIHEPERYGLADLHQLRGRVGRYKHRAYAYLLLDNDKPLAGSAVKRLKAIEEFTELGAGFKIALRDLEIRGAGNILGAEQSGHIEAVGYELYCSLLESAVRALTDKPQRLTSEASVELSWRAYLPRDYIPGPKLRVELYRRIGRMRELSEVDDFRNELIDRFGPLGTPAENLLIEAQLRILAERWQIARVHVEDEYLVLIYRSARRIEELARRHPGRVRVVDDHTAYVPLEEARPAAEIAVIAKSLLQ